MNAYDFDGTIYDGDCMTQFYRYALVRRPYIAILWPIQALGWLFHQIRIIDRTTMKRIYFLFFLLVNVDKLTDRFWDDRICRIKPWYAKVQKDDDLIISASPEFMIEKIGKRIGFNHIICSKVNIRTGKFYGINCRKEEKVIRFREVYGDAKIEKFYSDSDVDLPMAELADEAYKVIGHEIIYWDIPKKK